MSNLEQDVGNLHGLAEHSERKADRLELDVEMCQAAPASRSADLRGITSVPSFHKWMGYQAVPVPHLVASPLRGRDGLSNIAHAVSSSHW